MQSEIWSSVPMSEKYLWKKKASKLSRRMANRQQVLLSLQQKASRKPESAAAAAAASPASSAGAAAIKPAQTSRLKAPPSTAPIPNPVFKVMILILVAPFLVYSTQCFSIVRNVASQSQRNTKLLYSTYL